MRVGSWTGCLAGLWAALAWDAGADGGWEGQAVRAGSRWEELAAPLAASSSLGAAEREAYAFLLANLPLSDLAELDAGLLRENIHLAMRVRSLFPWSGQVPDELWRDYVLPHRVAQEPFSRWRPVFLEALEPRLRGLDMTRAALEVNHWCHEQVTYQPTDGRDLAPLSTCRRGFGRCEEETILTVCALRSVGLPARPCFTPFWAHMDGNHAWVEVWSDGRWHHLGACEPAPALDQAWFTAPSRRTLLVLSQGFGDGGGAGEPVLRHDGRSRRVNSSAVYGPVKPLEILVRDEDGRPLPGREVVFHLFNWGGWMPALAQTTGPDGRVSIECGVGSWLVGCADGGREALEMVPLEARQGVLTLRPPRSRATVQQVDYQPPAESAAPDPAKGLVFAEGLARGLADTAAIRRSDQAFQALLQREDSLREARLGSRGRAADSLAWLGMLERAGRLGRGSTSLLDALRSGRGNPLWPDALLSPDDSIHARRLDAFLALSDKDRVEIGQAAWDDLLAHLQPPAGPDSLSRALWRETILPARLDLEAPRPWRAAVARFLAEHPRLAGPGRDKALRRWIRGHLRLDTEGDRLGAPLDPSQVLALGGGARADLERFWLACRRVQGLPARRDPVAEDLRVWEEGGWKPVAVLREPRGRRVPALGRLGVMAGPEAETALGMKDWSLSRWTGGRLEILDLAWQEPLSRVAWPLELPAGRYALSVGSRRADGSATVRLVWVDVPAVGEVRVAWPAPLPETAP